MEKSSVKLVSNIMLKSRIAETKDGKIAYLPFDLLPEEYNDVRNDQFLTEYQKTQKLKKLFAARRIIGECSSKAKEVNSKNNDSVKTLKEETKSSFEALPKTTVASVPTKQHMPQKRNSKAFGLDESSIPEDLSDNARIILVKGDLKGWFFLIHYDGKLRDYIDKPVEQYHALLKRKGQIKRIVVSVSEADKAVFIHDSFYEMYKQVINDLIELATLS